MALLLENKCIHQQNSSIKNYTCVVREISVCKMLSQKLAGCYE
jgi:hypothetical protein